MSLTFSNTHAESFEQESRLKAGRKRPRKREATACACCSCTNATQVHTKDHFPRSGAATPPHHQLSTPAESPGSCGTYRKLAEEEPLQDLSHSRSGPFFRGSERKTRTFGVTHWLAPCDDMVVVKALLDRSEEFQPSRRMFNGLKTLICMYNSVPTSTLGDPVGDNRLRGLLPDRPICEVWVSRYCSTYGRIYGLVASSDLAADLDQVYMGLPGTYTIHQLRISLVVAIAMQDSETDRLTQEVETCVRTSRQFQKPCVGVVQVLLLLMIMKTISASDADGMFDHVAIQGLTSQVVFSMGLHRDPAMFPRLSPYYAEVRKRLWGCFLRLSLDCCLRSGTPLVLRSLRKVTLGGSYRPSSFEDEEQADADSTFGIAALKLAKIIAPVHQILCSPNPAIPADLQTELRTTFRDLLSTFSPSHRSGSTTTDAIEELQQSILSITMHSFLLVLSLVSVTSSPPDISQRGPLLEVWNYASSILYKFQDVCQETSEVRFAAFYFLWTSAGRAAFGGCVAVGRLCSIDRSVSISVHPEHSVSVFVGPLTKSLSFMLHLWKSKFRYGAVAAKTCLLLAVSLTVTSNLYLDYDGSDMKQKLFKKGILAAEQLIVEMTTTLHQHQGHSLMDVISAPVIENDDSIENMLQIGRNLDGDNPFLDFDPHTPSTYTWSQFNMSPDFTQLHDPLSAAFDEELPIDIAF
ncbi:hypothetical protein F5X99DRAFT_431022 [Biscogniauxia marginata]|nr:hypothetical protein F5X99DRAFT_431022 [Biscogniauxia marginata]